MLDGVVMAMILVITVITQDWHKLDEDKFDADGAADNKELEATQDTIATKYFNRVGLSHDVWCHIDCAEVSEVFFKNNFQTF